MSEIALGIIDAQRGFMPAAEGERLHCDGFGELVVPNGEQIVPNVNRLLGAFAARGHDIFTTQDYHPYETAHFSDEPDFITTWIRHCVAGTPGAKLHPEIKLPTSTRKFIKGFDAIERGEDDTSYSGYYAKDPITNETLPEWHRTQGNKLVVLGGLLLEYCVGDTAIDEREKVGLDVIIAVDATRGMDPERIQKYKKRFTQLGIRLANTEEIIAELAA